MNISFYLVLAMLTVWDSTVGSKETDHKDSSASKETDHKSSSESQEHQQVRCDQLPKESLDPADLIRITSFTSTHSFSPMFNCTKLIYVKSISPEVGYSAIGTHGDRVFYYDGTMDECGKSIASTECLNGMPGTWHLYTVRLESDTDGYFCAYSCSSNGIFFEQFICASAGNSVNPELTNLIQYLKSHVPGANAIFDARANCPAPKCTFFP